MLLNTSFDFRTDSGGKDPDTYSATLRRYHRALWSKPLPGGALFELDATRPGAYLYHRSVLGEFWLGSDSVIPSYTRWVDLKPITEQFPEEENEAFRTIGYTVGGSMVFPGNRISSGWTINQARGMLRRISDRMDLTLECIRGHYLGEGSPLADVLARYGGFFDLFEDFGGYVDFFLLQDLVAPDDSAITFFMPFDGFTTPSVPGDVDSYRDYRRRSIQFVEARNARIDALELDVPEKP